MILDKIAQTMIALAIFPMVVAIALSGKEKEFPWASIMGGIAILAIGIGFTLLAISNIWKT